MKFLAASISNFKLLRNVRMDFATDGQRPLTIVRAENASGKTSALNALRWGLFGVGGLEDPNVRLSPADWPDGSPCEIRVAIDFEHTLYKQMGGETRSTRDRYRLIRTTVERLNGDKFVREPERLSLYKLGRKGADPLDTPEARLSEMLPSEMKDIFFTDGDKAMNFISSELTRTTRRDQVKEAIKSLLGVGLLEDAAKHVKQVQSKLTRDAGSLSGSNESKTVAGNLEQAKAKLQDVKQQRSDLVKQIDTLSVQLDAAERALEAALQMGKYEELVQRRTAAKTAFERAEKMEEEFKVEHQNLLGDEALSWTLLRRELARGVERLNELQLKGVIPRAAVPVLRDRLELNRCICGASLEPGTQARSNVEALIEAQRAVDSERQTLTRLLHMAQSHTPEESDPASDWVTRFKRLELKRLQALKMREAAEGELRYCEEKLKEIDQADIQSKRAHRDALRSSIHDKEDRRRDLEVDEREWTAKIAELEQRFEELTRTDQKLKAVRAKLLATKDVLTVLEASLEELQNVYLKKVSDRMSELFLEMVGADPEQGSIFQRASISPEYEILVHTAQGRTLNPDHEVNGASQRALTFAFIWALTEVSGVAAPRVIDTPLGMMAGAVKRRVLEIISRPDKGAQDSEKQVVLFLTRSEIAQADDILDDRAGKVITFTNTDHYPTDLVNDPRSSTPQILTCDCTHRQVCGICQRKYDAEYGLVLRGPIAAVTSHAS